MKTRDDWRAAPPARPLTARTVTNAIVVHYVGSSGSIVGWSDEQVATWLRNEQRRDQLDKGMTDIMYSLVVDGRGTVWEARGVAWVHGANGPGSAVEDGLENNETISVCVTLGVNDKPTSSMLTALARLRDEMQLPLRTHRDAREDGTQCPGPDLIAWVDAFGAPTPHSRPTPTPEPQRQDSMVIVHGDGPTDVQGWAGNGSTIVELVGGHKRHISPDEWICLRAAGIVAATVPQASLDALPWAP